MKDDMHMKFVSSEAGLRRQASLSRPSQLDPAARQKQDSWRPNEMQELLEGVEFATQPPAGSTQRFTAGVLLLGGLPWP